MERFVLTDAQWAKMEPHCLGKPTDPGRSGSDNRRFVEAVLWIVRTGSPWRDLPPLFGNWNTVFKRHRDWVKAGVSQAFPGPAPRARHGISHGRRHDRQSPSPRTGRKRGTQSQAIGRSKGGMTTKILALTDALGNLVRFVLLPGQRFDTIGVPPLIAGIEFGALIADKAFDSNSIIADLNERRQDRDFSASPPHRTAADRRRDVQMAPSHRKLLLQAQGIQTHRHARRQNRPELQSHDLSHRRHHQFTMNLNRP